VSKDTPVSGEGRYYNHGEVPSCNTCGIGLVVPTWLPSSKKTKQYKCRSCKATYLSKWRKANPGAYKKLTYGITQEEYDALLVKQKGRCAICGTKRAGGRHKVFHIDHDHTTGVIRGLLCWPCNAGLGQFKDSTQFLAAAIKYLQGKHNGS